MTIQSERARRLPMDNELKEYRVDLLQRLNKLNENYDKLIVTLAGGALGLSVVFVKDILKQNPIYSNYFLTLSWILFVLSLTSVLCALLFGIAANKKAITQVDEDKIYNETPGGIFSKITDWLHYSGTFFLIVALIFLLIFVCKNMEIKNGKGKSTIAPKSTTETIVPKNQ